VELAAVWLHYVRDGVPCPILPVLCGSFGRFVRRDADLDGDAALHTFVETLRPLIERGRVLVVAAADLAHVGPAFGGQPLDVLGKARLKASDDALMQSVCAGDGAGFFSAIRQVEDRNNVCGLPPIYVALRLLAPTQGEIVAYDRCPADQNGTSLVSICGIVLS
jgi:predicted class III extradiol MEMO1 family dioxygenase